ncbi:ATP-binding cassette subfamily B protein [Chitinophaga niastensis]|uniref:ATP-binding cassette subfamily B protein n=1 Tax=Chitinophaga niastensis TaxID=536980 RepID=A0A2P8HJH8_CHINA|nr:ABC transporter ATP-binding protein [Chitinophaga niastensis]PSL46365.1 ATP-binding cassette subfamily B protein [Chitinophaga niastensis]
MNFWRFLFPKSLSGENELTYGERMAALRNLPKFFKMVWQTNYWLTITNALLRIIQSAIPLAILYTGKLIIDHVILLSQNKINHSRHHLWQLVAMEFGLVILSDSVGKIITLLDTLLGDLFANNTSVKILEHAAILDLDQFEDASFYDMLERARQQTVGRTVLLSQTLGQVQDIITMGFLITGLVLFNPWLILLLLIAVIPAFLGESHFNNKTYALYFGQTSERRELEYIRYLGASDETAKEVKIFSLSGFLISRFHYLSGKFYRDSRQLSLRRTAWGTVFAILGSAGYYGAYLIIMLRTVNGNQSIGDLTFMAGTFMQLRGLLQGVLGRFVFISQGAVYLRDLFDFFDIKPHMVIAANPRPFPHPIQHGFVFENVGFKYFNGEKWANRHLNFTLHAGEKLALVGENGAGKTTLVKLLSRLYDPTEGRILLDGYDLREYNLAELRMQVGIIFQDYLRYQMSVAQNIAIGDIREKENRALIVSAAKQSLANIFTEKLPGKYDQMLGRRFGQGIELSGGEWQKIALARAYMKDAQLLILDEPTAALDARAEYDVFLRFADLTRGRSSVLISHRFSTVRMADRILVLEKGELIEIGSHDELLAQGGHYAELFHLQAMGYR